MPSLGHNELTHWGRVTHICVSELSIIASDNGLSPGRRQAIIWTNAGIWLIRTLGTNFSEILGEIHSFSFSKMHLKMSSAKWRLFGLGLNELKQSCQSLVTCRFNVGLHLHLVYVTVAKYLWWILLIMKLPSIHDFVYFIQHIEPWKNGCHFADNICRFPQAPMS